MPMVSTFLPHIIGLVRVKNIVRLFGRGIKADAFNVAFVLPDMIFYFLVGGAALGKTACEAMNVHPRTIAAEDLAAKAQAILKARKITSLIAVAAGQRVEGVVHLHDLGVKLI